MPNLYTVPAGEPLARHAAAFALARFAPEELSQLVMLVPTRRSAVVLRDAFQHELKGKAALLPRMIPLAEIGNELLSLMGDHAFAVMEEIPPAMSDAQHRFLLAQQVAAFERKRFGAVNLAYALTLTESLMALQEQCARSGITITQEKLRPLFHANYATHWQQALLFLGILTDSWPALEQELGLTTNAAREVALLNALAEHWRNAPPAFPVMVVGSTASQPATAALLQAVAELPDGHVILPGLAPGMRHEEWQSIVVGHPLFHLKHLLDRWALTPDHVQALTHAPRSIWLDALMGSERIPYWLRGEKPEASAIHLIPCAHPEEEARTIALLLREAVEKPDIRAALITPDEGLMNRVAAHLTRYGITVDRLNAGTLATTETGSLWAALVASIAAPERLLLIRGLIHHPLLAISPALKQGLEHGWHGVNRRRAGQLPPHAPELRNESGYRELLELVREVAQLTRREMTASRWVETCKSLLTPLLTQSGQGHEAVEEGLTQLAHADLFGPLDAEDFLALLTQMLAAPWRAAGGITHPQIAMLTPVEARLQCFDRVILANMQDTIWPGITTPNPWLNLAAQQALGLPSPQERVSLMAHDLLMLGSGRELFLTYPKRDAGTPTTRSRFIERLLTLLAMHGITETELHAPHYISWANSIDATADYAPEPPVHAMPSAAQRPRSLPVSALDRLFTDPFSIYARYALGLRPLEEIDAAPEASDFGSITHAAIAALTNHWNAEGRAATAEELADITDHALRDFSERPNVALFWRARLLGALRFVNRLEGERRVDGRTVEAEHSIEGTLAGITLHGRIDRLEQATNGASIIDYKTGETPTKTKILEGRALQLLAYAMLLKQQGTTTEAVDYWALPRLGDEGEILSVTLEQKKLSDIETRLQNALTTMLAADTPFLARPISTGADERFGNDYDGISRYDEWAG